MAGLDLGDLKLSVVIDGLDTAQRDLDRFDGMVDTLRQNVEGVSKSKMSVKPEGERELKSAAGTAKDLGTNLDGAAGSAKKVKVDSSVTNDLRGAATAATQAKSGMDGTAGAADRLGTASGKAAEQAQKVSRSTREIGDSSPDIDKTTGAVGRLAGAARDLLPAISIGALGGTILGKGWDRVTSIDNAQFKLQGLGHEAESVSEIMDNAMVSVKGTAYGFGDAASIAAGAVAANIEPGAELADTLTVIADAAAISGRGMDEMGSIFNKVAANGKIQGDELNQLADSGIPILQFLSETMGVTVSEVRDLAAEGAIGFQTFRLAMEEGLGGAAQEMGDSISGSLGNVSAATGRLGAELINIGKGDGMEAVQSLTQVIDGLTGQVVTFSDTMSSLPAPITDVAQAMALIGGGSAIFEKVFGHSVSDAINTSAGSLTNFVNGLGEADFSMRSIGDAGAGFINMLGGPWAIAIGGATYLIGEWLKAGQRADEATATYNAGIQRSADLNSEFASAVIESGDALSQQAKALGGQVVSNALAELEAIQQLRAGNDMFNQLPEWDNSELLDAIREVSDEMYTGGVTGAKSAEGASQAYERMVDRVGEAVESGTAELERMGYSWEQLGAIVAAGGDDYDAIIKHFQDIGVEGEIVADHIRQQREEYLLLKDVAESVPESSRDIADGFKQLGDDAAGADDQVRGLTQALEAAGLIEMSDEQQRFGIAQRDREIREEIKSSFDEEGRLGAGLFEDWDMGGQLDADVENAKALHDTLVDIVEMRGLMLTMGESEEEIATRLNPMFEELAAQTGLSREKVEELAWELGGLPEDVDLYMRLSGQGEAMAAVGQVHLELSQLEEGTTTRIAIDSDEAVQILEDMGLTLEHLGGGVYEATVNADTGEALGNVETFITAVAQIQADKGITFHSNAAEAAELARILDVEVQNLGDGQFHIDSNSPEEIQRMVELGVLVRDPMTGEVVVASNLPEVLADAAILSARDGNVTREIHEVIKTERLQRVISTTEERNRATTPDGSLPGIMGATGGRFTGSLFRYADGARHDGYRLPTSGPGTGMVDGFLAFDENGDPIARLDTGEWVINGAMSERYDRILAQINAGTFPVYAAGDRHGASDTSGAPAAGMPGVEGDAAAVSAILDGLRAMPTEVDTQLSVSADVALTTLASVAARADEVAVDRALSVTSDTAGAVDGLGAVDTAAKALPEETGIDVTADTEAAVEDLDALTEASEGHSIEMDTEGLDDAVRDATDTLDRLGAVEAVPTAGVDITGVQDGAGEAEGILAHVDGLTPIPTADLNHQLLDAGVAHSEAELQRVGSAKATSVSDVDNRSALANIDAVIAELNKMPVERVIRVVAPGSVGGLRTGGEVPGLYTGGSIAGSTLPTSGPGTNMIDGFLGIDAAGMPLVRVNAGEYVVNDASTREYATELDLINRGMFPKLDNLDRLAAGADMVPGLWKGGVVSPAQLLDFAAGKTVNGATAPYSLQGAPYVWGGGLLSSWGDCSGAMSGLAALATGMEVAGRKFATMNQGQVLSQMGFQPGLGDPATSFNVGWFTGGPWGGHTAGDIGGTAVEMGGGAGGQGKIGGAAASASHPQFTDRAHIPLGELVAFDHFDPIARVSRAYQAPGAGGFSTTGGHGLSYGGGGGVFLHDTGGWHDPGTWSFNGLSQPEAVLTPEQWAIQEDRNDAIDRLVGVLAQNFPEQHDAIMQAGEQAKRSADTLTDAINNPTGENAVMGRALAGRAIGLAEVLELERTTTVLSTLTTAEADLMDARTGQAERANAVAEAERKRAEAYAALQELQDAPEGMSVDDQRKIADAEKRLAEARAGDKDGKVSADKVADAEEKLRRVREDVDANSVKSAEKRAEDIAKTNDQIAQAEAELGEARMEQVRGLDMALHDLVPGIFEGLSGAAGQVTALAGQAAGMGGVAAQAAPALAGFAAQLGGVAALAGPAGVSVGFALSALSALISVGKMLFETVEGLVDHVWKLREEGAKLRAEAARSVADLSAVIFNQREMIAGLKLDMINAQIAVAQASWDVRKAQTGVLDAHLEGLLAVAKAEEQLQAERDRLHSRSLISLDGLAVSYGDYFDQVAYGFGELGATQDQLNALSKKNLAARIAGEGEFNRATMDMLMERLDGQYELSEAERELIEEIFEGRFAGFDAENASIEESRQFAEAYHLMQRLGMEDILETATRASAEQLALQAEVASSELARLAAVRAASLDALIAAKAQQEALQNARWIAEDVARATERAALIQQAGNRTAEAATIEARIAELRAENAELNRQRNNIGNRIGDFFDFDGDGRIFGGAINTGAATVKAAELGIADNERLIEQLMAELDKRGGPGAPESAEDQWKYDAAAQLRADGNSAAADALLRSTTAGSAANTLDFQRTMEEVYRYEDARRDMERRRQEAEDELAHWEQRIPLEQEIARYERESQGQQYLADGYRAGDPGVRGANYALADHNLNARVSASLGNPVPVYWAQSDRSAQPLTLQVDLVEGGLHTSEDLHAQLTALNQGQEGLRVDVNMLKRSQAPSTRQVQLARAGRA